MPTFDDTLQTYQDKRTETRTLQGDIQTAVNEYVQKGKAIGTMKRKYNSARKQMIAAHDALIPELRKEAAAHPVMDHHADPDELPTTDAERVKIDKGISEKIELKVSKGKAAAPPVNLPPPPPVDPMAAPRPRTGPNTHPRSVDPTPAPEASVEEALNAAGALEPVGIEGDIYLKK